MIEEALRYHVINDAAVSEDIGEDFYFVEAPEGTAYPYIVAHRIDTPRDRHLRGVSGLARPRFQLNIFSRNYDEARTIAANLRLTLDARRQFAMGADGSTVDVRSIALDDEEHTTLPPIDGSGKGVRQIRQDYLIWHTESVPAYQ